MAFCGARFERQFPKTLQVLSGAALFALLVLSYPAAAALVTFDFEGVAAGDHGAVCSQLGCDYSGGALVSNGFVLDPGRVDWSPNAQRWIGHYHIVEPTDTFVGANNGTKFFAFDYFLDSSRLNIYGISGGVFGVQKLDLAEALSSACRSDLPPAFREPNCGVTFTGNLAGGGTISRTVTLDGIADGAGPLVDFETFTFDGEWNRLTMFTIVASHEYLNPGLDNLVLSTVPEPAALALLGIALGALGFFQRRCS